MYQHNSEVKFLAFFNVSKVKEMNNEMVSIFVKWDASFLGKHSTSILGPINI
jgi:hypothetical protein